MEELYKSVLKDGKISVDTVIEWMKDAKIVDGIKVTEESARKMFNDITNKENVDLGKFTEVLTQLASEQKKNIEDFIQNLTQGGTGVLDALKAGARAFEQNFLSQENSESSQPLKSECDSDEEI